MELSKKAWNDQEKKKMVIKIGGGGIGAVILLGGALATAVLASAFAARGKGRSSGKHSRRCPQNPPPENNKQSEQDEHPSKGAVKEVESDNDTEAFLISTRSSTKDEDRVETNGGTQGDVEASDQILCSISPKKLEKDAGSDDGFVIVDEDFPLLEEKLPLNSQNKMPEDEKTKVKLTKEDVSNDHSKENNNIEVVYVEEERAEREHNDDGKIEEEVVEVTEVDNAVEVVQIDQTEAEKKENMELNMEKEEVEGFGSGDGEITEIHVEAIERAKVDLSEDGSNQEAISNDSSLSEIVVSESHSEDGKKTLPPVFESLVIEHENVDDDEKDGALPTETVEVVQDDEGIEESQEDQVKYVEVKLVKEEEKCDQPDEGIVPEKCEEVEWIGEAKQSHQLSDLIEEKGENIFIPHQKNEENGCIIHPTPQNIVPMIEELSAEDTEVTKDDGANEEVAESHEVYENKTSMQFDVKKKVEREVEEEMISPEDIEITKDGANEEVPESVELNENGTSMQFPVSQPKDPKDDLEGNTDKEVEEELISHENVEDTKDDIINEEAAVTAEEGETKSLVQFVFGQPKEHEDDFERNITMEIEDSSEMSNAGIATVKDGLIMETSDEEEEGEDKIEDFNGEASLSDEVEESSVGTGDSSTESNSEAVWPAESLKDSSMEPQQVKLVNYEVKEKIQGDKTVKEGEHDNQTIVEENNYQKSSENFPTSEKTLIKKYMVEMGMLKDHPTNSTRRRMVIGMLSLLSSLSCSWFFGLSLFKLCLVVFLTMVLSEIHGY